MHKPNTFLYLYTFIVDHNICKHCLLVYHRQTDHIFQRSLNLKACSTYFFFKDGQYIRGDINLLWVKGDSCHGRAWCARGSMILVMCPTSRGVEESRP